MLEYSQLTQICLVVYDFCEQFQLLLSPDDSE